MANEYSYAGFFARVWATIIDVFINIGMIIVIGIIISNMRASTPKALGNAFLMLIFHVMYKCIFESSALQATPGKIIAGILVETEEGGRLTFGQAVWRFFMSLVSSAIGGSGYLWPLFSKKNQTLHDLAAKTVVVYGKPNSEVMSRGYLGNWFDNLKVIFVGSGSVTVQKNSFKPIPTARPIGNGMSVHSERALETLQKLVDSGKISPQDFELRKKHLLGKNKAG